MLFVAPSMENDEFEQKLAELEKRVSLLKSYKIELPPLFYWTYYQDGRVETNFDSPHEPKITQGVPLDEEVIEPPKPRWQSACKRCGYSWTRRHYKLPIQCPKCKSPYWNKKRKNP